MSSTSVLPELPTLDGVGDEALLGMLVAVVERLGRQELGGAIGDAELTASVGVLHRAETMVHAEKLRRVAEVDARAAYTAHGARSTADLLGRLGLTRGEAHAQTQTAAALAKLPRVAGRLAHGEIGVGQAGVAARALHDLPGTGDPGAVEELDELVAAKGASQDRRELGRTVQEWEHRRDGHRLAERERRAFLRRHLWAGHGGDGQPLLEGKLTPIVLAKLGAVLDPLARRAGEDDDRTIGQRRHDALETVLDRAAAVTDRHPTRSRNPILPSLVTLPPIQARTAPPASASTATPTVTRPGAALPVPAPARAPTPTLESRAMMSRARADTTVAAGVRSSGSGRPSNSVVGGRRCC